MAGIGTHPPDLIQKIPAGIVSFADDGNIVFINSWLGSLLGYRTNELHGKKIEQLFTLASRIFYQTHLFPLIKLAGKVEEIFLSLRSSEGKEVPVLMYGRREQTESDCINICIVVPVWQRQKYEEELIESKRRAERVAAENIDLLKAQKELEFKTNLLDKQIVQLRQINKQLTAFGKVISHDLQEPIRKISLFTNLIRQAGELKDHRINGYFQKADAAINRLVLLTKCLSQFVSVSSSAEQSQMLPLKEIISQSLTQASSELAFHDVTFETGDLPIFEGYASQIKQLFYELIRNSIQYREKSRPLRIVVTGVVTQYNDYKVHENRYKYIDFARVEYADNAVGFSNEYKEYVFEIFKRLHLDIDGLGFGLTLCRKIMDNHFGEISCQSAPGTGTKFIMIFPVHLPKLHFSDAVR